MSDNNPTKPICVADACSLLFSAQIKLKDSNVFDWLVEKYELYLCETVKIECFDNIQRSRVDIHNPQAFKREIAERTINRNFQDCLDYLDAYCERMGFSVFSSLHAGERGTIALALNLSTTEKQTINLLTDDFDAITAFSLILNEQKFGIVQSVPDFIINSFKTTYELKENETRAALQTYFNLMKKAINHEIFKKRMALSCRTFWFDNCASRCV